jgi:pimeloyl-ACP methyl ester carboxylesterase
VKKVLIAFAVALLFSGLMEPPSNATQLSLQGDWIGQIDFGSEWQRINFHFSDKGSGGTLDLPQQGRNGLPLNKITLENSFIHIEWQGRSGPATYDGKVKDGTISGEFKQGDSKGTFHLIRVSSALANLKLYDQYAGSYRLGPDRFVDLAPFFEDEDRPIFFDSKTRRTGVLYAISDTEFFSGPSYGIMFPIDIRVTFIKDKEGKVTGLKWQERGSRVITAKRVSPHKEEEITFHNGDVTLQGTLTMPATKGPHPVLILVHGSGPAQRPGGHWAQFFARHGVGYFYFDKRGSGKSSGDLNSASISDLAGDVTAAVTALGHHKNINPRQIGLIGHSNGGWVAPLAASLSKNVAFLIVKSGSGLSIHENILYELEMDMRGAGDFSEYDIAQAKALRKQLNNALLTNTGWQPLVAAIEKSKSERWFGYARVQWLPHIPPPLDSVTNPFLSGLRRQIDFDPAATWENVHCPVLVLLGELDANVPSKVSASIMESSLKKGANRDHTVRVIPRANHGLFESETGYSRESPRLKRYVRGYMDAMAEWLEKRFAASK